MDNFWNQSNFNLQDDLINLEIWRESPRLQQKIDTPDKLSKLGSVGPQQAMLDSNPKLGIDADLVLPWVPDLVGKDSNKENGLLIFGTAYAGFIKEYSSRRACLPLDEYIKASNLKDHGMNYFQKLFLKKVVAPDPSYYGKIKCLLLSTGVKSSQIILSDLCPNSLVTRAVDRNGIRNDNSSQPNAKTDTGRIFCKYVEEDDVEQWTKQRILQSKCSRIIALGHIVEHGLLRLFKKLGSNIYHNNQLFVLPERSSPNWLLFYADHPFKKLGFWIQNNTWWKVTLGNRKWRLLPIYHPATVDRYDPNYGMTELVLRSFLL